MTYTEQQVSDYITARSQRIYFYAKEADPMMAKVFAEEIEKSEWIAKKNEIKISLPYPTNCVGSELETYCKTNNLL
jgi:hypothetical protein|tara:strand:+ start:330 stop:557 length:228 start_codon:yes stop_codon:yes gene_type:complete